MGQWFRKRGRALRAFTPMSDHGCPQGTSEIVVFENQEDKQNAQGNSEADVTCRKPRSLGSQGDAAWKLGEPDALESDSFVMASRPNLGAVTSASENPKRDAARDLPDHEAVLTRSLREMVASRLPAGMSDADRETLVKRITAFMSAAQISLIEIALEMALGGPAPPQRTGPVRALSAATERPAVRPEERVAYRIEEVVALTGVSRAAVRKHIGTNIEARKVGGMVLLKPEDVHRTFGFTYEESVAPSAESRAEIEELLQ